MWKLTKGARSAFFWYYFAVNLPNLENLSHATIITGNRTANLVMVREYMYSQGIISDGNPDVFIIDNESLGVDVVRDEIIRFVAAKKVSEARFVVVSFDRATAEAQNALLKSIEEPQPGTYFILIVPKEETLLPTIISRSQLIIGEPSAGETRMDVREFLKANLAGRFAMVEEWTKNKKDEDNLSKTEVINFLDQLEKTLWEQWRGSPPKVGGVSEALRGRGGMKNQVIEQFFADIRQMRQYANIRGASHRVILDFIAMVAPAIK